MKTSAPHPRFVLAAFLISGGMWAESIWAAECPTPKFLVAGTYAAQGQPVALAAGDLNGDGRPDLVVANQFSASISVLLGQGDGTFGPAVNYPAGSAPSSIGLYDLDRDGRLDAVVSDLGTTNVWVLLGNGDGTFQAALPSPHSDVSQFVGVGDFNGDNSLDLAVMIRVSGLVSVALGNGDGTFQDAVTYETGPDPYAVAVGDLNGDNIVDLAVADASLFDDLPGVSILLGQGDGTFRQAVDYPAGASPRMLALGDFNGDRIPDLAVANYGQFEGTQFTNSSVSILLGNGNGTFQAPVNYPAGDGVRSIVAADFNGDGRPDLAVANERTRNISLLFGLGDGTFSAPANYEVSVSPRSVTAGDFNGDGRLDLAVVNENGALILTNTCFSVTTADLSLTVDDIPDPIGVGDHVTYTQTVRNHGPEAALEVDVSDSLPPSVRFVAATSSQGMCSALNNQIHCALGTMTNGSQATIIIEVAALNAGSVTNTARVSSVAIIDPNDSNNSAASIITVLPVIAVAATDASASESAPDPGVFTISRTGGTANALTVDYQLEGTASNGVDYTLLAGSVTIPGGSTFATVTVTPQDDAVMEQTETVVLTLLTNPSYRIDPSSATATVLITDNDLPSFRIDAIEQTGATIVIHFNTLPGHTYQLERTDNLVQPTWIAVADPIPGGGIRQVSDSLSGSNTGRFYRVARDP